MADLPSADEIKGLASLLAPGLIILGIGTRVIGGPVTDLKDRLISYALISAGYYAAATPIFSVRGGIILDAWTIDLLQYFILPIILGVLLAYVNQFGLEYKAARWLGLNFAHRTPAAWDYTFGSVTRGTFVLVTLADGSTVAGLMGEHSFASSSREERDLLLEEVWSTQGSKWTPITPKRSILICGRDVRYVEVF